MPDLTDKAAQAYSNAYQSAIDSVLSRYPALYKMPKEEAARVLSSIDFEGLFRENYGMNKALEGLAISFAQQVVVTPPPPVTPSAETLQAVLNFEIDAANTQITQSAAEIKKIMMRSILGRQSEAEFAAALSSETLRADQINSYVNQNLRSFHRTVELQMAEANPDQLYIWAGPLDDRTSPECQDMIAQGALSQAEWQANYGAYLSSGTHYGCRHTLQMYVSGSQLENAQKARGGSEKLANTRLTSTAGAGTKANSLLPAMLRLDHLAGDLKGVKVGGVSPRTTDMVKVGGEYNIKAKTINIFDDGFNTSESIDIAKNKAIAVEKRAIAQRNLDFSKAEGWTDMVGQYTKKVAYYDDIIASRVRGNVASKIPGQAAYNHEFGHYLQHSNKLYEAQKRLGIETFSVEPYVSDYALTSHGEYISEAFAAYMEGEKIKGLEDLWRIFDEVLK